MSFQSALMPGNEHPACHVLGGRERGLQHEGARSRRRRELNSDRAAERMTKEYEPIRCDAEVIASELQRGERVTSRRVI